MVLKRRQDGVVVKDGHRGGRSYLHAAGIAYSALKDGSDGAASTLKIVGDVTASRFARSDNDEAAGSAASSRELAFRLLYIRRPGAGVRRLFTSGPKVGGLIEKARGDLRIRGGHCKFEKGCRLFREVFLARHNTGSPLLPVTTCRTRCNYALRRNPFRGKVQNYT
ncbi:hypothetical protein V1290_001410 [Bradyrhizobium sp. AZCC 1578]